MPIYEYQCTECEHKLEALQKLGDEPLSDCPACSQSSLKKLVSAASFRLKGGGWYETDFKTGKKKQLADSDSQPQTGSGGGKTDADKAKPAAKKTSGKATSTAKSESKSTTS
jgi:putative FmdB family regulatory protein